MTLLAIIGTSLGFGFGAGLLVFVAFFLTKHGLSSFLFGFSTFVFVTLLVGLCQIRRVNTLPTSGAVGYVLFLFLFLYWSWIYVVAFFFPAR